MKIRKKIIEKRLSILKVCFFFLMIMSFSLTISDKVQAGRLFPVNVVGECGDHKLWYFTQDSGYMYVRFIDAYTGAQLGGTATLTVSGLYNRGWYWTNYNGKAGYPETVNMSLSGSPLGLSLTPGNAFGIPSSANTSYVRALSPCADCGTPYFVGFAARFNYSMPSGYSVSGTNDANQMLQYYNYENMTWNGHGYDWQRYYTNGTSTATSNSFNMVGATYGNLAINYLNGTTNQVNTWGPSMVNIYLERNSYTLLVSPNGGIWNGSFGISPPLYQVWGTTRTIQNPTPPASFTVLLKGNGGTVATPTLNATRYFTSWTKSGVGILSGKTYTYGIGDGVLKANYGTNAVILPRLTRAGWEHLGWSTNQNATTATYAPNASYTPTGNATLHAIWRKNITLTYDANGGTGASVAETKTIYNTTSSANFTISSTKPTKEGYEFMGWGDTSTQTSGYYSPGQTITLSDNKRIYALWKKDITLTYDANEGTNAPPPVTKTVYNSTLSANFTISSQEPTRKGYAFKGWIEDKENDTVQYESGSIRSFSENTVLYAVWQNNLGLTATITRMLEPHDPIFKMAETGILTIHTTGFAERVTVSFPSALYPDGKYNVEYILNSDEELSERESAFIIPLYCEEGDCVVDVSAYRETQSVNTYPTFVIQGTVLDELRTRIRSYEN